MTIGDGFEEKVVNFGSKDPNEDHHHPDHLVTQHCRSYVFTIGTHTKLRLIDTPGLGDALRHDHNIQHILSFINNLSHLNAICIFLKPTQSRLTVDFRSYVTRLLCYFGEKICNNIIFCFTNTRPTSFTPGNTKSLLKIMLESFPIKNIPFKKTNTFCFDNESFRYLIARQNKIEFDDYQRKEYKQSWVKSVDESIRLLPYICGELKPCSQEEWQSDAHAQFKITQLTRPILETIRNIFRNILSKQTIKLLPKSHSRPSTICYSCKRIPQRYGDFWILPDDVHLFTDRCEQCNCSRREHVNVDYRLDYELLDESHGQTIDKMSSNLTQLKQAIVQFGSFFSRTTSRPVLDNNPVMDTLTTMIGEEDKICQEKGTTCFNSILYNRLKELKEECEQQRDIFSSNIYEQIENINEIDSIREQMQVIKQFHQKSMKEQEREI
jgi:hypothetical protein